MKKLYPLILLLIAATAFGQAPVPSSAPSTKEPVAPQNTNSRKARVLLQQMIGALGGQPYLKIQTMEQEGRAYSYYQGQPNSMGTPFWAFFKLPDKERIELTKQRDVVYIYNGDKGYEKTYKGVALMEPKDVKKYWRQHTHSLEYVLRVWLPDPSTALFYDGAAVAEQKACDKVTLMNDKNDAVTIYINTNSHLPVKKTFQWRDPMDNLKNDEGEIFDNWRLEQGFMTAHTILFTRNGETTSERFLTSVKYNTPMPDSIFEATVTYNPFPENPPKK